MSRKSSRSSTADMYSGDFLVDCKAAYVSVMEEIDKNIDSKDKLMDVLYQSGRNPSSKTLNKYWKEDTEGLDFEDFLKICKAEPITTEADLMKAFKRIDINGDNYISLDELHKIMTSRGEKISRSEVKKMIDDVDENKDGRLDYKEFCKMVISTANESKKLQRKVMEKKERKRRTEIEQRKDQDKSPIHIDTSNGQKSARKMENDDAVDDDDIAEECVTARSETARSGRPTPSPRKSMSESLSGQAYDMSSMKDKTEDVSGSRTSLNSRDDVLLTSRRSSRSNTKDSSRSRKGTEREVGTPSGSRKSSLLSIDDLPKPSPRVKKDKVRQAPATKSIKLDEPKNLREWTPIKTKGSFFLEDGSLICHQYDLNLPDDTKVWITIQPCKNKNDRGYDGNPIDTSVFILRDRPDEDGNLLVAFSEQRDARGKYGVSCDLTAGKYSIMPYTTGCRFKERTQEPSKEAKIITQKEGKYVTTKAFRDILREIFDNSDLDGNGFLSRSEFNLYNVRTSGEEVADDEWAVVEDRIKLEDDEITFEGFLELNELEVEDSNGDTDDIWTTLSSMGYNKQLVMDQACPFKLDVFVEDCDDAELDVVRVDTYPTYPGDLSFEDVICRGFINHSELTRIKGMKDLCLYTYINDGWASLVLDNKSHTKVRVELDCKRSENVVSNRDNLQRTIRVDPGAAVIAFNLTPEDDSRDWQVKCTETIR